MVNRRQWVGIFLCILMIGGVWTPSFADDGDDPITCMECEPLESEAANSQEDLSEEPSEVVNEVSDDSLQVSEEVEVPIEEIEPIPEAEPPDVEEESSSVDPEVEVVEEAPSSKEPLPSESNDPAAPTEPIQTNGLLGVSLLSDIRLTGAYSDQVELTLTGQGVLDLNLLKDRFVIFQIPSALMPYLDLTSLTGSYEVPALIGVNQGTITTNQWVVDAAREQIYFRANQLLSVSVLNPKQYQFKLSFRLTRLPLGTPQIHTFFGHMTNELVRIDVLSDGRDAWTLEVEGPVFQLNVPSAIDFGSVPIRPSGQLIHRNQAMTVTVSHLRALGYAWRLTASATPLTSSGGHTLTNTVFFKKGDGTIIALEQGAQMIAEGTMTEQATVLTYSPTDGIFLNVQSQLPQPTTYQTTINWTLVNAP